ncbi:MAG: hypothetical protein HYW50_00830, partial [Candidatus Diapherotrites archaeon]|nr:hypothetical protein [Candidatus Diapherotrites archaeon]
MPEIEAAQTVLAQKARLPDYVVAQLRKKRYGIVGNHSAVQVCSYNKAALKGG